MSLHTRLKSCTEELGAGRWRCSDWRCTTPPALLTSSFSQVLLHSISLWDVLYPVAIPLCRGLIEWTFSFTFSMLTPPSCIFWVSPSSQSLQLLLPLSSPPIIAKFHMGINYPHILTSYSLFKLLQFGFLRNHLSPWIWHCLLILFFLYPFTFLKSISWIQSYALKNSNPFTASQVQNPSTSPLAVQGKSRVLNVSAWGLYHLPLPIHLATPCPFIYLHHTWVIPLPSILLFLALDLRPYCLLYPGY